MVLWTMSPAAALPTPNSRRAGTGKSTAHTTQRSTEDIKTVVKTNGKKSSHNEKYKIVNTNSNLNLGFMDVTRVKNFEIHDKENKSSSNNLFTSKSHSYIDRTPWQGRPFLPKHWENNLILGQYKSNLMVVQNGLIQRLPHGCPKLREGDGGSVPLLDNVQNIGAFFGCLPLV